jgi:hypothetical protein
MRRGAPFDAWCGAVVAVFVIFMVALGKEKMNEFALPLMLPTAG